MQNDSLHALLYQLNLNIIALDRTTEEIGNWIANPGSTTTSERIGGHLEIIEKNSKIIASAMAMAYPVIGWKSQTTLTP